MRPQLVQIPRPQSNMSVGKPQQPEEMSIPIYSDASDIPTYGSCMDYKPRIRCGIQIQV